MPLLMSGGGGPTDMSAIFKHIQDLSRLQAGVAGTTQNVLSDTSGGANPEYIANVATKQADTPDLHPDALAMVKKIMGGATS